MVEFTDLGNRRLLELAGVGCERDGRTLFAGLSVKLSVGELLQVEGANGAGKTTLLKIITGLLDDFTGQILWRSQPRSKVFGEFRLSTFYLGHRAGVKGELDPVENIRWRAAIRNESYHRSQIESALAAAGLSGYETMRCARLSAGQQRRVALADLSLTTTPLWILDEPLTALDATGIEWFESLLVRQRARRGMICMTSHQRLSASVGAVRRLSLADCSVTECCG